MKMRPKKQKRSSVNLQLTTNWISGSTKYWIWNQTSIITKILSKLINRNKTKILLQLEQTTIQASKKKNYNRSSNRNSYKQNIQYSNYPYINPYYNSYLNYYNYANQKTLLYIIPQNSEFFLGQQNQNFWHSNPKNQKLN
jgi:hypothetical protein